MGRNVSSEEAIPKSNATEAVLWSIALYGIWTLATYLLEGRTNLLQQPTVAGRYGYVLIADVLFGTIGGVWVIRSSVNSGVQRLTQVGFRQHSRTAFISAIAFMLGMAYLILRRPAAWSPLVILNGYA